MRRRGCPVDESLELAGLVEAADLVDAAKAAAGEEDLREGGPAAAKCGLELGEGARIHGEVAFDVEGGEVEDDGAAAVGIRGRGAESTKGGGRGAGSVEGGVFVGVVMDDGLEVPEVGGGGRAVGGASGGGVSTNLHPRRPHKDERERERERERTDAYESWKRRGKRGTFLFQVYLKI
ncbi:hypothetical protein C4D60_Mb11t21260 [Musa balbisiana]|uniref:Uncharacterized protein n=1 Tax=Musa balbisiana TaxID=52838 RepID=A0A4S8J5P9_MUSBA|nr:hypothetical protein C4D60_Mb11t21260 [Musa balbisiana]